MLKYYITYRLKRSENAAHTSGVFFSGKSQSGQYVRVSVRFNVTVSAADFRPIIPGSREEKSSKSKSCRHACSHTPAKYEYACMSQVANFCWRWFILPYLEPGWKGRLVSGRPSSVIRQVDVHNTMIRRRPWREKAKRRRRVKNVTAFFGEWNAPTCLKKGNVNTCLISW